MTIKTWPARALKEAWTAVDYWIFSRWRSIANVLGVSTEPSYTDKQINEQAALNSSTVFACSRVIADPISFAKLHLFQRVGDDERKFARDHVLYRLLRYAPHAHTTAIQFRQTIQRHALLWGNGYARIYRHSGNRRVLAMAVIPPDSIGAIQEEVGGPIHYRFRTKTGTETLRFDEVFHLPGIGHDGVSGESVIGYAKNSIGLDMAALEYGSRFFARGGRVPYILKHQAKFKDDAEFEDFRKKWEAQYSGPGGYGKAPVLQGGLEYQQIGFKPEDSQLLATRKFSVEEICRWFLVYPFEVGDMSRANFSNIAELTIDRIYHTLNFWLTNWEQQIWLRLLSESEKETYYAEFDRGDLVVYDLASTIEALVKAKANGIINADFVSARMNWPKLPNGGGAAYHFQMNQQTVPGTGEPTALEQAALARAKHTTTPKQTEEGV